MSWDVGVDYIGVTVSFICVDGKGKLLLQKRGKGARDEHGNWDNGGGQLKFGETPQAGVLRELKEELGCEGKILHQFLPVSVLREMNGQQTHWLSLSFIILIDPKDVKNCEPDKIDEIGWFKFDELPSPLHTFIKQYILGTELETILRKYL